MNLRTLNFLLNLHIMKQQISPIGQKINQKSQNVQLHYFESTGALAVRIALLLF